MYDRFSCQKKLERLISTKNLVWLDQIDSTNNEAKRRIAAGICQDALIVADSQTAGRGRQGKSFFSPDNGVFMTVVFADAPKDPAQTTIAAAVAIVEALESATGLRTAIKWVNDIYYNGKKVSGILSEVSEGHIVVGIGINCDTRQKDFPAELQDLAGGIPLNGASRVGLIADIHNKLRAYVAADFDIVIEKYRAASLMYGKEVSYLKNGATVQATVAEIDDCGRLVVIREDGTREALCSGEVSIVVKS